jgi:CheY-like chemotaxis protein
MTEEPKVEHAPPSARGPARETFRILIVDTVENTERLKTACKEAGHDVVGAHSIDEAFAFLDGEDHADVIICATHLENESMFEFLERLRSNAIHKDTMFLSLALSPGLIGVKMNSAAESTGRLLGADAFVTMPEFDADLLISEINKLLPPVPMLEKAKQEEEARK